MERKIFLILAFAIALPVSAAPEDPVHFVDSNLQEAVEFVLGPDPTPTRMLDLISLDAAGCDIFSLEGLEHALNIRLLDLRVNWITDISPLSGLVKLEWLYLEDNMIADVCDLSPLTSLELLGLEFNSITDISALASLENLVTLWLYHNQVSDISPLASLTNLNELDLDENHVADVSPLALLTALEYLWLYNNQVEDTLSLAQLSGLIELDLGSNRISDISTLTLFDKLELLALDGNPLNTPAYCRHLPLIELTNPLTLDYLYDPNPNPFTADCSTDMSDLAQWTNSWLDSPCNVDNNWCAGADLDHIGDVELPDFAEFGRLWLAVP